MAVLFNAEEIIEIAVEIECGGQAFYARAASLAQSKSAKQLFLDLVGWEKEHENIFRKMLGKLSGGNLDQLDPDDNSAKYLQAIANGRIFDPKTPVEKLIAPNESLLDILRKAEKREKDSVVFYTAMKVMVPPKLGRGEIEKIIQEEISHVLYLNDKIDELEK